MNAAGLRRSSWLHGAFADSSGRNGVIERLQATDVQLTAAATPLRGISIDPDYVAALVPLHYPSLNGGEPVEFVDRSGEAPRRGLAARTNGVRIG